MTNSQKLIEFAQAYLKKQPFDIVHDFEHHQLVVTNCQQIIQAEELTPETDVIMTAAWWHDVEKSYTTANSADTTVAFFQQTAAALDIDPSFIERCAHTISEHSFNRTQTTLESQILFDADKIEYVNNLRIKKLINDFHLHPEKYQTQTLQHMHQIWISRIKKVPQMMHFDWSRKLFLAKLNDTENILEQLQRSVFN